MLEDAGVRPPDLAKITPPGKRRRASSASCANIVVRPEPASPSTTNGTPSFDRMPAPDLRSKLFSNTGRGSLPAVAQKLLVDSLLFFVLAP